MATDLDRVHSRLDELANRLEQLELLLGFGTATPESAAPKAAPVEVVPPPVIEAVPWRIVPAPIVDRTSREEPVVVPAGEVAAKEVVDEVRNEPALSRRGSTSEFEQAVGSRWLAWVGALIVIVGIGLFVKYAYDQGWIRVPPAWRCIAGAVFGLGLLATGEVLRRKVNAVAAAGVLAAGVGSIYASVLAAHELYHLVPPAVALVMLGATSMAGVAAAMRSRLVSVGALSLIGGYLAPILVTGETLSTVVLPSYLLLLLAVGVVLAGSRAGKFGWLRFVTWWGTFALGSLWMARTGLTHPESSIPFLFVAWALVHAELAWSSMRGFAQGAEPAGRADWDAFNQDWRRWRPMLSSFGMTAWATGLAILIAKANRPELDWLAPAVGAVASALCLGVVMLPARRTRLSTDAAHLAMCLAAEAGGLVLLAIGMALTGWVMAIGWLMLGLTSACAAAMVRSRPLLVYGVVALTAGTVRLLAYDWAYSGMNSGGYEVAGLRLTTWTGMMLIGAATWLTVGLLSRKRLGEAMRPVAVSCIATATSLVPMAFLNKDAAAGAMSIVCLVSGLVATALHRGTKSVVFLAAAPAFLLLGLGFAVGTMWWAAGPGTFGGIEGLPLRARALIPAFGGFVLIAAGSILPRDDDAREVRGLMGVIGAMMLYAALMHDQSRAYAMSWAWLGLSVLVAGAGMFASGARFLATGLGGLLAAAACWVAAYVMPGWSVSRSPALLHPGLWGAACIGGAAAGLARVLGTRVREETRDALVPIVLGGSFLMLLAATSLEVARVAAQISHEPAARGGAVSIWWAIVACGLIVGGFARRISLERHAGLGFLFIVGAKIVLFDLHEVTPAWRIASFLSVGLLMLLVAVGYARLAAVLTGKRGAPA